jgi:hypothetical protein
VIRFEVDDDDESGGSESGFEEGSSYTDEEELDVATLTAGGPARAGKRRRKPQSSAAMKKRRRKMLLRKKRRRTVRPSPPLEKTDPLGAYLAGQMVPCPVGCGGFSEVVRIATLDSGAGEVWFECLSCAQRRAFEIPAATAEENEAVGRAEEEGREPVCPRHDPPMHLRRRGRQFACPGCGVIYSPPGAD